MEKDDQAKIKQKLLTKKESKRQETFKSLKRQEAFRTGQIVDPFVDLKRWLIIGNPYPDTATWKLK